MRLQMRNLVLDVLSLRSEISIYIDKLDIRLAIRDVELIKGECTGIKRLS